MTLLSCDNIDKNTITVIGQANNMKDGAVVLSNSDKKLYYVDGVSRWDEKFYGKEVKVTGQLKIFQPEPQDPDGPVKQQSNGVLRLILKPKWELVK